MNDRKQPHQPAATAPPGTAEFHSAEAIDLGLEVHDYVMGRLTGVARQRFEARLEEDEDLAREVATEQRFAAAMAARPGYGPDAHGFERLRKRLLTRKPGVGRLGSVGLAPQPKGEDLRTFAVLSTLDLHPAKRRQSEILAG